MSTRYEVHILHTDGTARVFTTDERGAEREAWASLSLPTVARVEVRRVGRSAGYLKEGR